MKSPPKKNYKSYLPPQERETLKLLDDRSVVGRMYIKVCLLLKDEGVADTRMPTLEHFLSKLVEFVDTDKLSAWIKNYAVNEKLSYLDVDLHNKPEEEEEKEEEDEE